MVSNAFNAQSRDYGDKPANPWKVIALLAGFVTLIATLGGLVTRMELDWYRSLNQPWYIPPEWAFGPAWTLFFILMTIAAWLVWRGLGWPRAKTPMALWVWQLLMNLSWSVTFFGLHQIGASIFVSLIFIFSVALTTKAFFAVDKIAGWLMVPVCVWVVFAGFLSVAMWYANTPTFLS